MARHPARPALSGPARRQPLAGPQPARQPALSQTAERPGELASWSYPPPPPSPPLSMSQSWLSTWHGDGRREMEWRMEWRGMDYHVSPAVPKVSNSSGAGQ